MPKSTTSSGRKRNYLGCCKVCKGSQSVLLTDMPLRWERYQIFNVIPRSRSKSGDVGIRNPCKPLMTLRVMSFCERQRERIATPVCATFRNDIEVRKAVLIFRNLLLFLKCIDRQRRAGPWSRRARNRYPVTAGASPRPTIKNINVANFEDVTTPTALCTN